uniref:Uncharacterized protein n=1 Tax=Rhodopseudomonas palustris (strain DX-1) TaxID=652103 RepID=E6VL45_RHOPX
MTNFALTDETGLIVNRIILERPEDWDVPPGHSLYPEGTEPLEIGGTVLGGVYTAPRQPPSIPLAPVASVTPKQARLALLQAGLLDQVEAVIAAGSKADQITWEFATEIRRDDPLLVSIGSGLTLSSDQIDVLFKYAATL